MSKPKHQRPYDNPSHPDLEKPDPRTAIRSPAQATQDPLSGLNRKLDEFNKRKDAPIALRSPHHQALEKTPQGSMLAAISGVGCIPKQIVKDELIALADKQMRYQFNKGLRSVRELTDKTEEQYNVEKKKTGANPDKKDALKTTFEQLKKMEPNEREQKEAREIFDRVEKEINDLVDSCYDKAGANINLNKLIHEASQKVDKACQAVCKNYVQKIISQNKELLTASTTESYRNTNKNTGKAISKSIKAFQQQPDIHFFEKTAKISLGKAYQEIKQSEVGLVVSADAPAKHTLSTRHR